MSGTSLDGVDAVLVNVKATNDLKVCDTFFTPYPEQLKADIGRLSQSNDQFDKGELLALETTLDQIYSNCAVKLIEKASINPKQITAIANHGQTIRHSPDSNPPLSLQLGNGQRIANLTGIKTICRFRQADLEVGGQGAPLMPAFHRTLFSRSDRINTLVNIGGIANISLISAEVTGYDTGPGNTLMNQWIAKHKGRAFDKNGDWARSGNVVPAILKTLLSDPYFSLTSPKSTGTEYFNLQWLYTMCEASGIALSDYRAEDIQATLLRLTCETIATELKQHDFLSVYVCGGGAQNKHLMQTLSDTLKKRVEKTDEIGIPADWVEAVGFAWLGYCHEHGLTSNLPSVTGAKSKVVLGESYLPKN